LWSSQTWAAAGRLVGHDSVVTHAWELPDGRIVTNARDKTYRIWRGEECLEIVPSELFTDRHPRLAAWIAGIVKADGDWEAWIRDRSVCARDSSGQVAVWHSTGELSEHWAFEHGLLAIAPGLRRVAFLVRYEGATRTGW